VPPSTTTTTTGAGTTSTTAAATTTTSTTLPVVFDPLAGAKLVLTDDAAKPAKRSLLAVSTDAEALTPAGADPTAALLQDGATLRVVADGGDGFDTTYALPATGWKPLRAKKPALGARFTAEAGPVTSVVLKWGRQLAVKGRGPGLGHSLATEPDRVRLLLTLGAERRCIAFGGEGRFTPGKKLTRKRAPAADCTAP
jgi:hypothetical protein